MSIITITLINREFKLSCPEDSHHELLLLAEKLDLELKKIKQANPSASFELLLVMLALELIDAKQKEVNLNGGDLLKEATINYQMILSSVFEELKGVAKILQ